MSISRSPTGVQSSVPRIVWMMCPDYRRFECARCQTSVAICPRCDSGQRYCSLCSHQARRESVREAGRRYQQTPRGRYRGAQRQARYRERQRAAQAEAEARLVEEILDSEGPVSEKVTHQASPVAGEGSRLDPTRGLRQTWPSADSTEKPVLCHFCGGLCRPVARRELLRRRRR